MAFAEINIYKEVRIMSKDMSAKNKVFKRLEILKKEMMKFFYCNKSQIKFFDPIYSGNKANIKVSFNYINKETSVKDRLTSATFHFDFEMDFKRDVLLYLGNIYSYDELNSFFTALFKEIKELE
jgi:hypothetical protein